MIYINTKLTKRNKSIDNSWLVLTQNGEENLFIRNLQS